MSPIAIIRVIFYCRSRIPEILPSDFQALRIQLDSWDAFRFSPAVRRAPVGPIAAGGGKGVLCLSIYRGAAAIWKKKEKISLA